MEWDNEGNYTNENGGLLLGLVDRHGNNYNSIATKYPLVLANSTI